jgi:hypothetical protein
MSSPIRRSRALGGVEMALSLPASLLSFACGPAAKSTGNRDNEPQPFCQHDIREVERLYHNSRVGHQSRIRPPMSRRQVSHIHLIQTLDTAYTSIYSKNDLTSSSKRCWLRRICLCPSRIFLSLSSLHVAQRDRCET